MNLTTRADSIQNKTAIIKAALRLFRTKGVEIPLSAIAKEANISRMTFYRHFPDRNAVVSAVFHYNLDLLDLYAKELYSNNNGFYLLLQKVLIQRVEYHSFLPYINKEEQVATSKKLIGIFKKPIEMAKANRLLRDDFCGSRDLLLLISMMGGAVFSIQNVGEIVIERTLDLIMNGIKVSTRDN